nr:retrotransposon protein, putative, Ty1-copia subclass [Tanacetum cinerariifolium]
MDQSVSLRIFGNDTIKLDRINGMNFTRWKEQMKFLLTAFKVYYVLEGPHVGVMTEEEQRKNEQDKTLCRGYILRKNNKGIDKKRKGTWNSSKDNKKDKKSLSDVVCYKCGEKWHIKRYCKNPKKKNQNSNKKDEYANAVEMVSEMNIGMIQELHMASVTTTDDWWKEDGHEVMMGDNHTSKVIGSGNMEIQFTSGKKLTLQNVLYVPNIRKNLVSGFKLCKSRVKAVIESDKKGIKPNISYFRVWGYLAYYKVPLPNTSKLGPKGLKRVFVGYAKDSKSYHCLDLDSNIIVESRDVDFFENKFRHDLTSTNETVTQIPQDNSCPNLNSNNERNTEESSSAPRRSERARKERILDYDFIDSQAIIFLFEGDNKNNVINKILALLNVEDEPKTYKEAITSRNSTVWKEVINDEMDSLVFNNTPGSKAIGCRWVFRIKYHIDGSIQTFKARLVIQGFSQRQRVDYFDKYAPTARITSIRVLFALTSIYNFPIHQMDVKTAFLNEDLDEEVYMKQPERFVLPDDILIVGTNMEGINETKKFLSLCFQMKDMNEVDTILGIKVKRHSGGYALNQCYYIDKIIDKFQHLNIEEANTPYEPFCKLVENDERAIAQIEYASAIGYSDASWITSSSDSKSTTGWIFTLGDRAVYWGSKKQTCITHSTIEAEFLALAATGKEAEWLRNIKMAHNNFNALPLANLNEDSKKRKCKENLRTWKWNEVIDVDAIPGKVAIKTEETTPQLVASDEDLIDQEEDLHEASSDIEKELYEESSDQEEFYDEDSSDLEEYLG